MADLISRRAAINKINERQRKLIYCFGFDNDMVKIMDIAKSIITAIPSEQSEPEHTTEGMLRDDIHNLPSVQPERKKGKWMPHSEKSREYIGTVLVNVEYDYWLCDVCGYRVKNGQPMYNFCPNCGADMRGGKGGTD